MTTLTSTGTVRNTVADSTTMLRRNLLHMVRYPGLTGFVIGIPVILLLMFVYVFGGTLGAGLSPDVIGVSAAGGGGGGGGAVQQYLAYVLPGILFIGIAGIANGASIGVAMDMTEGIVARFRSMAISRTAVLTGHVLGNTIQGLLVSVILIGAALLMGLRPTASPLGWLGIAAIVALVSFAVSWLGVALGVSAKTVESASNTPMVLLLLVFLGSGFVPASSMPGWLQGFAQYQPFTTFIETVRALMFGADPGLNLWLALGWAVLLGVVGYVWARTMYVRRSVR
ncbi:ABC transporter permease [Subtercola endophyticus]|uniref:ABC transporter permease n=1 Tax=Subtercola endophyticus TaxID=2895559 RepID=UPI001E44D269|nr:ABC transporter permease [Subtercola endophyticus]UFS58801.1 ABC transporter permease [Subtercola endophyticus]